MIFTGILTGFIFPSHGSCTWGGSWLTEAGFSGFAGSTIVHSVGGWAALTGALILGPRKGKYGPDGAVHPMPGANLPLATLGTFILWIGWFGFTGAPPLALGSALAAVALALVYATHTLAPCAGKVSAFIVTPVLSQP